MADARLTRACHVTDHASALCVPQSKSLTADHSVLFSPPSILPDSLPASPRAARAGTGTGTGTGGGQPSRRAPFAPRRAPQPSQRKVAPPRGGKVSFGRDRRRRSAACEPRRLEISTLRPFPICAYLLNQYLWIIFVK